MRDREYREDDKRPTPLEEMGYETEDLDVKKFAGGISVLFIFIGIASVLALGTVWLLSPSKLTGENANAGPVRRFPAPPAPLLQSNITKNTDLYSLQQDATKKLNSYGVVDEQKDVFRIPIRQAEGVIAQRGLASNPFKTAAGNGNTNNASGNR